MDIYPTDEKLIEDFKECIRIPGIKASLYHQLEHLKIEFKDKIEEYREMTEVIDPKSKQEKPTGKKSVKLLNFELEKIKGKWTVFPFVHPDVINHIIAYEKECEPGVIKMGKIKLHGKMIDLSFEMKSPGFIVGSIVEKCSEKKPKQKTTSKAQNTENNRDKTEDLKTLLSYLLNNDDFFQYVYKEFRTNWKPLIDNGCLHG